jgi:hypothetical protein
VYIIRRRGQGEHERIKLDGAALMKERKNDQPVQPGDRIFVQKMKPDRG